MVNLRALFLFIRSIVLLVLTHSESICANVTGDEKNIASGIAGYSYQQALILGERIYREGILPDGGVVKAFVQRDIPVDGQLFACVLCHRRSGLGTSEGHVVALPTNSLNLFRPRVLWDPRRRHSRTELATAPSRQVPSYLLGEDLRPSYTDQTLRQAIRTGIDPAGRTFDYIMPRYDLNDRDMALLVHYLKNLTREYSLGVTDKKLRFATIVTEDVNKTDRDAMLAVLKTYIKDKNAQTRNQLKRARSGAFNRRELDVSYRTLELAVWELKGAKETWYEQLEEYHHNEPVFAVLGGITDGDWAPIHEFSESRGLPVVFPVTDRPVISTDGWNTVYFSKGLYQEGEAAARYIRRQKGASEGTRIIQVYKKGSDGEIVANGFKNTWKNLDIKAMQNYELQDNDLLNENFWKRFVDPQNDPVILFWGNKEDLLSINILKQSKLRPVSVFVSSSLMGEDFSLVPDELRDMIYITYPYSLPGEKKRNIASLKTWLKIKGIPVTNLKIQSKMYFVGGMLSDILVGMKSEFYRDYFLERIEMMKDQTRTISVYPRLSLGPNQRYASKGCYIVQITKGKDPTFLKKGDWVIH